MAVDPVIQELMDLIEPPDNGDQARSTSDFGAGRTTGSNPHGGFDENRGRGVQPHGRVTSPVYGIITRVDPKKLGRILPFNRAASPTQDAPGGIPGLLKQIGAFDPPNPDQPLAGGLLRLLQDYMRNNPDGGSAI